MKTAALVLSMLIFGSVRAVAGPALEFNRGALPNVHLHIIVPAPVVLPAYSPRASGVGKVWYKVPIRVQKSRSPWTAETVVNGVPGYRNYPFASVLVTIGMEVYYHGPEGAATPQTGPATLVDPGGYYKFHGDESYQPLFCYCHTAAGQTENYAYPGPYRTCGKKADNGKSPDAAPGRFFGRN